MSENYFVDGGTLLPDNPSYVPRAADKQLLQRTVDCQFSYLLTARQMGKSSLMIRTAHDLRQRRVSAAIVDLTIIGTQVTVDQWYVGVLSQIKTELRLNQDIQRFWRDNVHVGPPQRFVEFLRKVVLQELRGNVAIFIDEIDITLSLPFRDDFFGAIRATYNLRANDSEYNRLTFVLLGVAAPTDLIDNPARTPFNIGERIVLQGFRYEEARQLRDGLHAFYPQHDDLILRRVFYWTNGHPYMTQRLCRAALEKRAATWSDTDIDTLVQQLFLTDEARRDPNLTFVRDRVRALSDTARDAMLRLYRQVLEGNQVPDDDRSRPNLDLKLYGLVTVEQGNLQVSNKIYERVFNLNWISENEGGSKTGQHSAISPPLPNHWIYVVGFVLLILVAAVIWLFLR